MSRKKKRAKVAASKKASRARSLAARKGWEARRVKVRARVRVHKQKVARLKKSAIKRTRTVGTVVKKAKRKVRETVARKRAAEISRALEKKRAAERERQLALEAAKKRKKKKAKKKPKRKVKPDIISEVEEREYSTRVDFDPDASPDDKLDYICTLASEGKILRFTFKARKGMGSPEKRAKKTGRVIKRKQFVGTGWVNFGSLSCDRIAFYLERLGGTERIVQIFFMEKR